MEKSKNIQEEKFKFGKMTVVEINQIDLSEDELFLLGNDILDTLLKDRTTGKNIYWATDDYAENGEGYGFYDEITVEKITGFHDHLICPRVRKNLAQQRSRSKNKAEVFTPSWVCNAQNNLIDEAWFGRANVFNTPFDEGDTHTWQSTKGKIEKFPEGKDWMKYVNAPRMEMACGEAPYLCSRYDTTNGKLIELNERIGLLDRKMRLVSENASVQNVDKTATWRNWAIKAYQATYGFEYQGDSLLLARESLLWSYREYYKNRWGKYPHIQALKKIAEIISWNIWQMDGLTLGLPGYVPKGNTENVGDDNIVPHERLCRIMEWEASPSIKGKPFVFQQLKNNNNQI